MELISRSASLLMLMLSSLVVATAQTWSPTYLSPAPNSEFVSTATTIAVRMPRTIGRSDLRSATVRAVGTTSGAHDGELVLSSDERTLVFRPATPFAHGEAVLVSIVLRNGDRIDSTSYRFNVTPLRVEPDPVRLYREELASASTKRGARLLDDAPTVVVTTDGQATPGDLFLTTFKLDSLPESPRYLLQLRGDGEPRFRQKMPGRAFDFKLQPNGNYTYFDEDRGYFIEIDREYNVVDSFMCGNGYRTDLHELQLLPNGHALLLGMYNSTRDLSQLVDGGRTDAWMYNYVVQELDREKNVVFEWRCSEHFSPTDAMHEDLTAERIDFVHANAIELDHDGNIMISSRSLDEITKIDRESGEIIWRWGGKKNMFTFIGDTLGFSHQHDIRRQANGNVTLYDNGNFHPTPFSRALEIRLDESAMTATLVWEYRNTPSVFGFATGAAQRLPNGNTLITWGISFTPGAPTFTEVTPDGKKVLEGRLPAGQYTYRVFKFDLLATSHVAQTESADAVSVSPNPFDDRLRVRFTLSSPAGVSIHLYDLLGREQAAVTVGTLPEGEQEVWLDASELPAGMYLYRLTRGGVVSGGRVEKAR